MRGYPPLSSDALPTTSRMFLTAPVSPNPVWTIQRPINTWRISASKREHVYTPGGTHRHTHSALMAHPSRGRGAGGGVQPPMKVDKFLLGNPGKIMVAQNCRAKYLKLYQTNP